MNCFSCGSNMVRGVCRCCGRVARRRRHGPGSVIIECVRCHGGGEISGWNKPNSTCPVCHGKGKVRI